MKARRNAHSKKADQLLENRFSRPQRMRRSASSPQQMRIQLSPAGCLRERPLGSVRGPPSAPLRKFSDFLGNRSASIRDFDFDFVPHEYRRDKSISRHHVRNCLTMLARLILRGPRKFRRARPSGFTWLPSMTGNSAQMCTIVTSDAALGRTFAPITARRCRSRSPRLLGSSRCPTLATNSTNASMFERTNRSHGV